MKKIATAIVATVAVCSLTAIAPAEDVLPQSSSPPQEMKQPHKQNATKHSRTHKKHKKILQKLKEIDLGHETAPGGGSLAPTRVPSPQSPASP